MLCRYRLSRSFFFGIVLSVIFVGVLYSQTQEFTNSYGPNTLSSVSAVRSSPPTSAAMKVEELRFLLGVAAEDPVILNNLAVFYATENRLNDALELSMRSVSLDGKHAGTRINLARIYDRLGRTEKARAEAAAAAVLDPKSVRIRSYACELELVLGHGREAADCYRRILQEFPRRADVRLMFGAALIKSGQFAEAKKVLERERTESPHDTAVLSLLATVHYNMKEYVKCTALLKQAVEANPDDPRLRYNLGVSYLATKNRPGALSQYNLIKGSDPVLAGKLYRSLYQRYILDVRK